LIVADGRLPNASLAASGLDAVKLAQSRIDAFATRWRESYPVAVCAG